MGEVERIVIKKFYAGRASLFGLYYGVFLGLILGLIAFLVILISEDAAFYVGQVFSMTGFSLAFISAVILFIFFTIFGLIAGFIGALVYNLISKLGGDVHFDLGDYEVKKLPVSELKNVVSGQVSNQIQQNMPNQQNPMANQNINPVNNTQRQNNFNSSFTGIR